MSDIEKGLNLNDLLNSEHTRGQFCLIIYLNNKLTLISDRLGYYPVYFHQEQKFFNFKFNAYHCIK